MTNHAIHFAITSHGLGHLTRTVAVLRALNRLRPDLDLHVSTTREISWILRSLDCKVHWRRQDYEPGALQRNCFEVEVSATLHAYRTFIGERETRFEEERAFLSGHPFAGVVCDAPALPVRAAADAGLPAIGLCNFTWDWILEPWCQGNNREIVELLRRDYQSGTCQLRLPFGPKDSSFPRSESAPLLVRQATREPGEVRRTLGLDARPVVLVCPGGWPADDWPRIHARTGGFQLLAVGNLPITTDRPWLSLSHELPGELEFPDLVASADIVLGKAGYGLASECLAHRTTFAMIDRPGFRETPCLVEDFLQMGRGTLVSIEAFFSGEWESILERAATQGSDWVDLPADPATKIARRVIELIGV